MPETSTPAAAPSVRVTRLRRPLLMAAAFVLALAPMSVVAAQTDSQPNDPPNAVEGALGARGERLLAGASRYDTAALLAAVTLDADDATTDDIFVVSGDSLVDALSAVPAAAASRAAIVLTGRLGLPGFEELSGDDLVDPVVDLMDARDFATATVVGGEAAVSAAVAEQVLGLTADDELRGRIAGRTRYETAVEVAREAHPPGTWCDTERRTAMMVNGKSLVDGVIAAPVAYAWELPLLYSGEFARPERINSAVIDYLRDPAAGIERVVLLGSPTDIPSSVLTTMLNLKPGLVVTTIVADTAAERSVLLARAIEHCETQPFARGEFALLDAGQPVDGVAAAAALATGLGEHSTSDALIPVLAVGGDTRRLPAEIAEHLGEAGRANEQVTLYALGGTARITKSVMTQALNAADVDFDPAFWPPRPGLPWSELNVGTTTTTEPEEVATTTTLPDEVTTTTTEPAAEEVTTTTEPVEVTTTTEGAPAKTPGEDEPTETTTPAEPAAETTTKYQTYQMPTNISELAPPREPHQMTSGNAVYHGTAASITRAGWFRSFSAVIHLPGEGATAQGVRRSS